ncbi:CTP synthase [Phycisphaerales bacterium AB-hyl4]|uniref:CTP synthase (glutamine hydrolyzing) n=1 Tax=Natronomicrosphaera hydrolytica TaxID=3242702 RepID=A0ABV4U6C0_9BACT
MPHTPPDNPQDILTEAGQKTHDSEFFNPVPPGYKQGRHKYVVVLGTVMSGLGKGIFSSSLAKLLKDKGLTVAPIKMEGYLNIDSGTLNPYRHGEVFVLDDGLETDMDLGTYERMLDQNLTRDNYVTSGQVFRRVLDKERHGGYLGRDVQMIPHVTGEVKYMLRELAVKQNADVVFVEVGGTVGDYENGFYIEALRQLAFEEGENSVCFVALTYVIEPPALGEQKSKAAQLGLKKLMEAGVQPHLVACRAHSEVLAPAMEKIAMFSNVPMRRVFSMHDRQSIYTIPEDLRNAGLDREVLSLLDMHSRVNQAHEDTAREQWRSFVRKLTGDRKHKIRIGITGKYASLRDAYASIDKAIEHCGSHLSADVDVEWIDTTKIEPTHVDRVLKHLDGVIVPGGFGQRGTESKIACVRYCRENDLPYLGICLGFQMAVIEYARNVCNIDDASSSEFDANTKHAVIDILPEQKQIEGLGGSMRLGGQDVQLKANSLAAFLYRERSQGDDGKLGYTVRERFRHRYEVDPSYIEQLEAAGLVFSGRHPKQPIMQILELPPSKHPYFIGAQFHPELTGRPLRPQPMFMGLVAAAIRHASPNLTAEQITTRWLPKADLQPAS